MTNTSVDYYKRFTNSVLILTLIILLTLLILKGFKVLLLILGSILFATYFLGIATYLNNKIKLNKKFAIVLVIIFTFSSMGLLAYKISPSLSKQIVELKETLPLAVAKTDEALTRNEALNFLAGPLRRSIEIGKKDEGGYIKTFFSSVFGVLGDLYIIVFLGFFFIANAKAYKDGIVSLFPIYRRQRVDTIIKEIGFVLRSWLLGKLMSMIIVGSLVTIGLSFLGVPQALTLGVLTSILAFIPNIGPLISLIPALLIAFSQSIDLAISTLVVYLLIQAVESNFITPMIHKQMIAMPMAMILIAQVVLGMFTGYLGLILAVPFVAIIIVIIKKAYIEDIIEK